MDTVIKFTVLQPKDIHVGQKVVGRYGNKSVIAQIVPWQLMPRTTDGRPLDMLANAFAVPNRIIAFATYESSMTFQMERMWEHILKLDSEGTSHDDIMNLAIEFVTFISIFAIGWDGIRMATVSSPPVVSFGIASDLSSIIVSGPGQNLSASAFATSGSSFTKGFISSNSDICTIRGLSEGRPFAAYILADAVLS